MSDYVVSPLAAEDLNQIWEGAAENAGEAAADSLLRELMAVFRGLAEFPGKGHRRQDLTPLPLHFYFDDPYLIAYRRDSAPLAIHAVLHASRNVATLLKNRSVT